MGCSSLTALAFLPGELEFCASALQGCSNLTSVKWGVGFEHLSDALLSNCSNLLEVRLPTTIKSIDRPFLGCSKLKAIEFDGTVAKWQAIPKNKRWDYGLTDYVIYCLDGNIGSDGEVL